MKKAPLDFTYKEYKRFLIHVNKIASVFALRDWDHQNGIILRHDVDFDIPSAYHLSRIEKKLGVNSTYFIMASNYYYNPLFQINSKLLRDMVKDGFEIGLHFDPSIYENIPMIELRKKVKLECTILQTATSESVRSISLHNPSLNGLYPLFKGYNNSYSKAIFSDENYISDSCMDFRGKDPYEFIKKASNMPVQIVLHPEHWSETGRDYVGYFTDYIIDIADYIDRTMRVNRKYKEIIGKRTLKKELRRSLNERN